MFDDHLEQLNKKYLKKITLILKDYISFSNDNSSTSSLSSTSSSSNQTTNYFLSGYLFKRSHGNTFKKWNRRWFTLLNSKLFYQRKNDFDSISVIEADLRVCKVREISDTERRFTFEIVSPKCRHILQADSQRECSVWVRTLDRAINSAINNLINLNNSNEITSPLNADDSFTECHVNNEFLDTIEQFSNNNESQGSNNVNSAGNYLSVSSSVNNSSFKSLKDLDINNLKSSSSSNISKTNYEIENKNKNFLLTTIKGNQNCCDCGASNPNWVF